MSEENIEIVRRVYAAYAERGELPLELVSKDFEFDVSDVMPDAIGVQDLAEAEPVFRSYAEIFDGFQISLEEVIAANEAQVVTAVRDGGRIKGTDAEVRNQFFHVWTLRSGKVVRWSSHAERHRALEAAELSE